MGCVSSNKLKKTNKVEVSKLVKVWVLGKVRLMTLLKMLEMKLNFRSKSWGTRTKKRMKIKMPITKNRMILKCRMILMDKCTPRKNRPKEAKARKANRKKQTKRWVMLMKNKNKKI